MPLEFVAMTVIQVGLLGLALVCLSRVLGRWSEGERRAADYLVLLGVGLILAGCLRWFLALAQDLLEPGAP